MSTRIAIFWPLATLQVVLLCCDCWNHGRNNFNYFNKRQFKVNLCLEGESNCMSIAVLGTVGHPRSFWGRIWTISSLFRPLLGHRKTKKRPFFARKSPDFAFLKALETPQGCLKGFQTLQHGSGTLQVPQSDHLGPETPKKRTRFHLFSQIPVKFQSNFQSDF